MTGIDDVRRRSFEHSELDPSWSSARSSAPPTLRSSTSSPSPSPLREPSREPEIARAPSSTSDRDLAAFAANVRAQRATESDAAVKAKLDAFRDRFAGPYLVDGESVSARPMFRMNGTGFNQRQMEARRAELGAIASRAGLDPADVTRCQIGRPSPIQLVRVTQALLDAGKLPPPPGAVDERIRRMQWEWGIGVDCAGYASHAAVAIHGARAASLLDIRTDPFSAMTRDRAKFVRVATGDIRAGDVIHLDPPGRGQVGHNVIVHGRVVADDAKRAELSARGAAVATFLAGAGPFHVLEVDSSWGADDGKAYGGFRRETWIFDADSLGWGYFDVRSSPPSFHVSQRGPGDEPFTGAFRPRG